MNRLKAIVLGLALAVPAFGQLPPVLPTNSAPKVMGGTAAPAVTNLVLRWDGYTNAWFEVVGCTNLAEGNWYHVTNVPIAALSVVLANTRRQEFWQVKVRYSGPMTTNQP
jgi:hypothetical protein